MSDDGEATGGELPNLPPFVGIDRFVIARQQQRVMAKIFGLEPDEGASDFDSYVLLQELGRGGMGVVYAAYDDRLERKVAIKIVASPHPELLARFDREAKTMARLAHPNVVHIYQTGKFRDYPYIEMEYVEGVTLRTYLAAPERELADVVRVFGDAGRGLAAAHELGLVHRDFKPENVMIGKRGRVKVMDFGLAASALQPEDIGGLERTDQPMTVTRAGVVLGTPVYMSPEQWRGGAVDARADQFSFCVALWEALYGARPFHGETIEALRVAVESGPPPSPSHTRFKVPRWQQRVLERGLSVDPDARYASMTALLDALGADPRTRRRRWLALALLGCFVVLVAWLLHTQLLARDQLLEQREEMMVRLVDASVEAVESDLGLHIAPLELSLRLLVDDASASGAALEPDSLTELAQRSMPVLRHVENADKVTWADEQGRVLMLSHGRESAFRSLDITPGQPSVETQWSYRGRELSNATSSDSFDPRGRPWYVGARGLAAESLGQADVEEPPLLYWSPDYTFMTSGALGMSVSAPVPSERGEPIVVAIDLRLTELSKVTLRPVIFYDGAQLFALSDDLRLLGLPREALALLGPDALLGKPLVELDELPLTHATLLAWLEQDERTQPFRFMHEGTAYWAGISELDEPPLWVGVAVPEDELLAGVSTP